MKNNLAIKKLSDRFIFSSLCPEKCASERTVEMQGEHQDSGQRDSQSEGPGESRDLTKSPSCLNCIICKLSFASNKSLRNHRSGSRHRKKAKTIERKNCNVCPSFYCELCCIELSSEKQQQQHLKGKNHEKQVMAQRVGIKEREVGYVKDCERSANSLNRKPRSSSRQNAGSKKADCKRKHTRPIREGHGACQVENQKAILETLLQSTTFSPQFIKAANVEASRLLDAQAKAETSTEKKNKKNKKAKEPWYFCKVCSLTASSKKQLEEHFKGMRHKRNVSKSRDQGDEIGQEQAERQPNESSKCIDITKRKPDDRDKMVERNWTSLQNAKQTSCDVKRESTHRSESTGKHPENIQRRRTATEGNARPHTRNVDPKCSPSDSSEQHQGCHTRSRSSPGRGTGRVADAKTMKSDRRGKLHDRTFAVEEHSHRHSRSSHSESEARQGERKVHKESKPKTSRTRSHHREKNFNSTEYGSRNTRRSSDSQLEMRRRGVDCHREGSSNSEKLNSRRHNHNGEFHSREHHIRETKRGLSSGSETTRHVHGGGRRGSTTVHTERIARHEDKRRLGHEYLQRNGEMRGINETKRHVPTEREKRTARWSTGINPNCAAQENMNADEKVDSILKSKYLPEPTVRKGFNGTPQSAERHSAASLNIWDGIVVYDYNHGIHESLDENTNKKLDPSSHQYEKTVGTLKRHQLETGDDVEQHKRYQEQGDALDPRTHAKRRRLLDHLSASPFPVVEVKTESELDDDMQYKSEDHVSVWRERTVGVESSEPDRHLGTQSLRMEQIMNTVQPNVKEQVQGSRLKQSRERDRCASRLKPKEKAGETSKKQSGTSDKLESSSARTKTTKEGSGMLMLPLEHIERQRAKVLKILNLGTQHEIENLNGVGKKRARMIMQWRLALGGFKDVAELSNILGFGEKMLKAILL